MTIFKPLVLSIIISMSLVGITTAKEWKQIRIGSEGAYPPFNYFKNDQLAGFDIDIAKALCTKMKVQCIFVAQDWDGMIPALLANKYDAIMASMSITEERKKKVRFSEKYYNPPVRFVIPKNSDITDISPDALVGKTIGAQSSTTHSSYLEDLYKGSRIKLYDTLDAANYDLTTGRLDLVLADALILVEWLEKTDDGKCCKFVGKNIENMKYFGEGAGIAVRQNDKELADMFSKAIQDIIADGTYEKINIKYFPFNIY